MEQINELGGIKNLGGAKLKLIKADTGGNPDLAASETERLIVVERCAAVGSNWPTSIAGAEIAERYETPAVHDMGVADTTMRGYKFINHTCNTGPMDARECYITMSEFPDEKGIPRSKTCYLLYNQDDAMVSFAEGLKPMLADARIEVIGEEIVPPTPSTYVPQLIKIEALAPDVLWQCAYTPDCMIFFREMYERKTYFPHGVSSCGAGTEDPDFFTELPAEYYNLHLFVQEDSDAMPDIEPWYEYLNAKVQEKIGKPWTGHLPSAYCAIWVIKDALERVVFDPNLQQFRLNLQEAIRATDISLDNCPNATATLPDGTTYCAALVQAKWDRITFDETGQNVYSHGQISQIIDDVRHIMWPFRDRQPGSPDLIFPIPPWDER